MWMLNFLRSNPLESKWQVNVAYSKALHVNSTAKTPHFNEGSSHIQAGALNTQPKSGWLIWVSMQLIDSVQLHEAAKFIFKINSL